MHRTLPSDVWRTVVMRRIGKDVHPASGTCPRCRKAQLDPKGDHSLSCKVGGLVGIRRDAVRNRLCRIVREAGLRAELEHGEVYRIAADPVMWSYTVWFPKIHVLLRSWM